jgi:hypothetical protein
LEKAIFDVLHLGTREKYFLSVGCLSIAQALTEPEDIETKERRPLQAKWKKLIFILFLFMLSKMFCDVQ